MKYILLVEDDPFIIDIYSNTFKREDFSVDVAVDGEMALEKIKNHIPDLVVLDLILPKLAGWDVLRQIRSNPVTEKLKVVVISNLNEKENAQNIASLQVAKYFLKIETTPEEILETVKEILA